jgi:Replication-relaxation
MPWTTVFREETAMPKDKLGRRLRFTRTPVGKTVVMTKRDIAILRLLYRYRYLRLAQLIAFLKPKSEKRLVERLGDLFHETGFIERPKAQWREVDARCTPMIYELTRKGERYLAAHALLPHRVTSLSRRSRQGATVQFGHAMMIVDALADIELKTLATPDQRFVSVGEILSRAPQLHRKQQGRFLFLSPYIPARNYRR